jgi:hypothetical protein
VLITPTGIQFLKNQPTSNDVKRLRPIVERYTPLYGPNYQISSLLTWDHKKLIPKLPGLTRTDLYDHMPEAIPKEKTIYVLKHIDSDWPTSTRHADIKKLEQIDELELELFQVNYE